jgi:hypothetical protein
MQTHISIGYQEILNLASLLPKSVNKKLILDLQKSIEPQKDRVFGKYDGQVWMSDDFNEPLKELI